MRLAAALLIGAGLLIPGMLTSGVLMSSPAAAQDAGIFGLIGLGSGDDKDPIQYLERPPLVVPKSKELPPPAEFNAKQAAWPRDPDLLAKKRRARERVAALKETNGAEETLKFIQKENAKKQRKAAAGLGRDEGLKCTLLGGCVEPDRPNKGVQPEYVDPVLASGEPRRQYLTDPPTGLRVKAPAPPPGTN